VFRRREEIRKWLSEVEKFRQKGAVSPDKAMTAEELGLPSGFQEAMHRRLGRSGIFVEVNGKYYLNEERLKEVEEQRQRGEAGWDSQNRLFTLRMVRTIVAVVAVVLLLASFFYESWALTVVAAFFIVAWLALIILQIYYASRIRRRLRASTGVE
jgi:ABC-type multidrug transport system fused ATPase/permease subunit